MDTEALKEKIKGKIDATKEIIKQSKGERKVMGDLDEQVKKSESLLDDLHNYEIDLKEREFQRLERKYSELSGRYDLLLDHVLKSDNSQREAITEMIDYLNNRK